jgi:hypothetical protein
VDLITPVCLPVALAAHVYMPYVRFWSEAGAATCSQVRLDAVSVGTGNAMTCAHAANAMGNFCFEATLGYRRLERGR